jgi:hypothetical protein
MSVKDDFANDAFMLAVIAAGLYLAYQYFFGSGPGGSGVATTLINQAGQAIGNTVANVTLPTAAPAQGSSIVSTTHNADGSMTQTFSDGSVVQIPAYIVQQQAQTLGGMHGALGRGQVWEARRRKDGTYTVRRPRTRPIVSH